MFGLSPEINAAIIGGVIGAIPGVASLIWQMVDKGLGNRQKLKIYAHFEYGYSDDYTHWRDRDSGWPKRRTCVIADIVNSGSTDVILDHAELRSGDNVLAIEKIREVESNVLEKTDGFSRTEIREWFTTLGPKHKYEFEEEFSERIGFLDSHNDLRLFIRTTTGKEFSAPIKDVNPTPDK